MATPARIESAAKIRSVSSTLTTCWLDANGPRHGEARRHRGDGHVAVFGLESPARQTRDRLGLPRQLYGYILMLSVAWYRTPVAESSRAGDLMPATALQTFKAQFFRALSHPVRIKILEILIGGDRSVQELQEALKLDQPVVSQQLAVLRNQGIVTSEKKGLSVRYALRDPTIEELLDVARRIFNNHLVNTRGMLRELQREGRRV